MRKDRIKTAQLSDADWHRILSLPFSSEHEMVLDIIQRESNRPLSRLYIEKEIKDFGGSIILDAIEFNRVFKNDRFRYKWIIVKRLAFRQSLYQIVVLNPIVGTRRRVRQKQSNRRLDSASN